MHKKNLKKKLVISTQTLRRLTTRNLELAAGGRRRGADTDCSATCWANCNDPTKDCPTCA
jgi:hypothetical protein